MQPPHGVLSHSLFASTTQFGVPKLLWEKTQQLAKHFFSAMVWFILCKKRGSKIWWVHLGITASSCCSLFPNNVQFKEKSYFSSKSCFELELHCRRVIWPQNGLRDTKSLRIFQIRCHKHHIFPESGESREKSGKLFRCGRSFISDI